MNKKATLVDDLKDYLEYKESYLRAGSYKVYRLFGSKFLQFLKENDLTDLSTSKVKPELCERYRRYILKLHSDPTTRRKEIIQMKSFFKQFTKSGWERYKVNPAANIELTPKQDSELHEPFSEEQVAVIFGRILEKRDYWLLLYIYFIHYTFSRPGREVRLMKVGDIKAHTVVIRPDHSKTRRSKAPTIPKPLEQLIDYLKVKNYPLDWYIFGQDREPGPIPCGNNTYYHRHRQILKECKITGRYTLYGWKHTGNIRAVGLGVSERELQLQNGFKDSQTLEIYLRRLSAYHSSDIYDKFSGPSIDLAP